VPGFLSLSEKKRIGPPKVSAVNRGKKKRIEHLNSRKKEKRPRACLVRDQAGGPRAGGKDPVFENITSRERNSRGGDNSANPDPGQNKGRGKKKSGPLHSGTA